MSDGDDLLNMGRVGGSDHNIEFQSLISCRTHHESILPLRHIDNLDPVSPANHATGIHA